MPLLACAAVGSDGQHVALSAADIENMPLCIGMRSCMVFPLSNMLRAMRRFYPGVEISDDISTESARVNFLQSV